MHLERVIFSRSTRIKGKLTGLSNYRAIKLTSHTLKIYERVVNNRLKNIIRLHDNQWGFVEGKLTIDAIQCLSVFGY